MRFAPQIIILSVILFVRPAKLVPSLRSGTTLAGSLAFFFLLPAATAADFISLHYSLFHQCRYAAQPLSSAPLPASLPLRCRLGYASRAEKHPVFPPFGVGGRGGLFFRLLELCSKPG